MSASTVSTATSRHPFDRRVEEVKPSKTDINNVIMDYLVSEGYPAAASRFALEANISPLANSESIQARVDIRNAIHQGQIQDAIERINELSPEILDCKPALHFALLRLQLIELIRTSSQTGNTEDLTKVFGFASAHLAPRAPTHPEFQDDLEKAMALLIYPADNLAPHLAVLLDPQLRQDVASSVNQAILDSQGLRREAKIKGLVRLRTWAEAKAREEEKNIPSTLRFGLDGEEHDANMRSGRDQAMNGNGQADPDAMIT